MSLQELIAPISEKLTPTERRISSVLLEDPTLLAFGTVSDLATRVGTSRPSIVRFATKLGFEGYTQLQSWMREDLTRQLTRPSDRIRQGAGAERAVQSAIEASVRQIFEPSTQQRLDTLAGQLVGARCIWIVSGETSMAGAIVLQSGLSMIRDGVCLLDEHAAGRQLSGADDRDAAVAFDFPRYRANPIAIARLLTEMKVRLIAITDGPMSPLASMTEFWCGLTIPAAGPFDSAIPSVLSAELLVARVARLMGKDAETRIDRLESAWQSLGTYMEYRPRVERGS